MKKDTTQKKIEANRKNALNSTGPKSAEGKRRSSKNALKYGIYSQDAVIGIGSSKEDLEEYQQFHGEYREYQRPEGTPEEILVDTIVEGNWRKKRILRCETAEITRNVSRVRLQREITEAERFNARVPSFSSTANGLYMNMLETSWGQQYLIGVLDKTLGVR